MSDSGGNQDGFTPARERALVAVLDEIIPASADGRLPGAGWLLERMYRFFLRWRPTLQRWAARLD